MYAIIMWLINIHDKHIKRKYALVLLLYFFVNNCYEYFFYEWKAFHLVISTSFSFKSKTIRDPFSCKKDQVDHWTHSILAMHSVVDTWIQLRNVSLCTTNNEIYNIKQSATHKLANYFWIHKEIKSRQK